MVLSRTTAQATFSAPTTMRLSSARLYMRRSPEWYNRLASRGASRGRRTSQPLAAPSLAGRSPKSLITSAASLLQTAVGDEAGGVGLGGRVVGGGALGADATSRLPGTGAEVHRVRRARFPLAGAQETLRLRAQGLAEFVGQDRRPTFTSAISMAAIGCKNYVIVAGPRCESNDRSRGRA